MEIISKKEGDKIVVTLTHSFRTVIDTTLDKAVGHVLEMYPDHEEEIFYINPKYIAVFKGG